MGIEKNTLNQPSPENLRTSELRYRRLFESARDGILILDAVTRKITDVNPFMSEFLGYTREEFLGKELWEIGLLKDEEESAEAFKNCRTITSSATKTYRSRLRKETSGKSSLSVMFTRKAIIR
jgi:PAS domain S-box-containing protein